MSEQQPSSSSSKPNEINFVNIKELPGWISNNIRDKKENGEEELLLLRPKSLSQLYSLFYYEYIRYELSLQSDNERKLPTPKDDKDINLPENIVLFIMQCFFEQNTYKFFNTISAI